MNYDTIYIVTENKNYWSEFTTPNYKIISPQENIYERGVNLSEINDIEFLKEN
jgi:hypothetical protein